MLERLRGLPIALLLAVAGPALAEPAPASDPAPSASAHADQPTQGDYLEALSRMVQQGAGREAQLQAQIVHLQAALAAARKPDTAPTPPADPAAH